MDPCDGATGREWKAQVVVKANVVDSGDHFGTSMAISPNDFAVAAPGEASCTTGFGGSGADNACPSAGAIYVID